MKCPVCGYSDEPLKDSDTGVEIKPGDIYDVLPNGALRLVKKPVEVPVEVPVPPPETEPLARARR